MLLTKLSNSGRSPFWSKRFKGETLGLLIASEGTIAPATSTTLDLLLDCDPDGRVLASMTLSDFSIVELLYNNGLEIEDADEACTILANMLVDAIEYASYNVEKKVDVLHFHLKKRLEGITLKISLDFHIVLEGDEVSDDVVRIVSLPTREPRKESPKKRQSSQGTTQGTTQDDIEEEPPEVSEKPKAGANVTQMVKRAKSKKIKLE